MRKIAIGVKGMSCGACVKRVEDAVSGLDGVERVEVELSSGQVRVSFDETAVNETSIKNTITETGYQVE